MIALSKPSIVCLLALLIVSGQASGAESSFALELKKIADETSDLNVQKSQVLQTFQVETKACWQNFAVNDCLAKVRREKYLLLAPLEQQEIALNAKRRTLKEADRQQRLNEKSNAESAPINATKVSP